MGVVAIWLLHCNQYMRQYYSERYNRDVQVYERLYYNMYVHSKLNHKNFYLKRSWLVLKILALEIFRLYSNLWWYSD